MMKKILLNFTILFLCHTLYTYSLREHVLSADVVVVAELVLVGDCQQRCLRELLEEKIAELSEIINHQADSQ